MKTEAQIAKERQEYGTDPLAVRDTSHYQAEYIQGFVSKWDRLISWETRAKSEGNFFIDILKQHGAKKVLDVATGTGFHSIRLLKAGFDVVSADGSPEMLAKAFENGRRYDLILRTVQADWRWLNRDIHGKFDAVICLGNSFTHLFSKRDRRKALAEFYAALRHDGLLILDQRNYDAILDVGFSSKHIYYYCGDNIKAEPEYVDDGLARFRYEFPDRSVYHLNMFPLRKDYTRTLMHEVGFQRIKTYGDFQETYHHEEQDFFIHVAEKSYNSPPPRTHGRNIFPYRQHRPRLLQQQQRRPLLCHHVGRGRYPRRHLRERRRTRI
jgi:SAM-dependent methyltransferase